MNLLPVGAYSYKNDWWRFGRDRRRAHREDEEKRRLNRIETGNRWFIEELPADSTEPPFDVMIVDYSTPGWLRPSRPPKGTVIGFFETKEAGEVHLRTLTPWRHRLMSPDGAMEMLILPPKPTHYTSDDIQEWRDGRRARFLVIDRSGMWLFNELAPALRGDRESA